MASSCIQAQHKEIRAQPETYVKSLELEIETHGFDVEVLVSLERKAMMEQPLWALYSALVREPGSK